MQTILAISQQCFDALIQLRNIDEAVPRPDVLQNQLRGFIDEAIRTAQEEGHAKKDVQDMAYALVSLADEIAATKPPPLGRYWAEHSLQLSYFKENVAGDEFFRRLQAIRTDPRRAEILRVYHLCLLFGFQGYYGAGGNQSELLALVESINKQVQAGGEDESPLSPRGERPDEALRRRHGVSPLILVGIAILLAAASVYIGLRVSLNSESSKAIQRLEQSFAHEKR